MHFFEGPGRFIVETAQVQVVEACPALAARIDASQCRFVARAPFPGEGVAIDRQAQRIDRAGNATVPIDDGAENVEGEDFEGVV